MATLLLKLVGPLQSWGVTSRFVDRDTGLEPSKSGVTGLLCAALGRDRHERIDDVAALRMGVRVDRPGTVLRDFHTALDVVNAEGSARGTVMTERYYLADAAFWVGLEGDRTLLESCDAAIRRPRWPPFLGRKACPPGLPVWHDPGVVDEPLEEALAKAPRLTPGSEPLLLRLLLEDPAGSIVRPDQPASNFAERRYVDRRLRQEFVSCT